MKKRWVFDIYLDDLPSGNLVGENNENEDFETQEEAEQDAKGYIYYLCEEYDRKESDFRVEYYQISV